ncbi:hypothetical protein PTSG_08718 [Salpingoeca rosetta]|uniref:JmjC domain-containing protein n=1 Tax=Salpingoeca rosetta (strain ATCC 50818 / BSB-021) TaxID=946362 RepID=F2UKH4_SALR5|nr:uncharacterized protein PTSG_08718 [Salpingoeca rosetta]EGD77623.1 hypothetical protein PTSG_08718 [Salpingoeca rosetta]|eukprot:XP_004990511.1 hypothetical protein PTSG_08718 [Salpingoeca rosetta]
MNKPTEHDAGGGGGGDGDVGEDRNGEPAAAHPPAPATGRGDSTATPSHHSNKNSTTTLANDTEQPVGDSSSTMMKREEAASDDTAQQQQQQQQQQLGEPAASTKVRRSGRQRNTITSYAQFDVDESDSEDLEPPEFDIVQIVEADAYPTAQVVAMNSRNMTPEHILRHGLTNPLLFTERDHLDMKLPPADFTISQVRDAVGAKRKLDVLNVQTQEGENMTMQAFTEYFASPNKTALKNVISLEFSRTRLDPRVQSPRVVRHIDLIDNAWPPERKQAQRDPTNNIKTMKYPKVQKYCLMSVGGCFTDFHIDMGGTSVWYHILRGSKIFWVCPPTDHNMRLFKDWTRSHQRRFFGDLNPEHFGRIDLSAGNTFFIPSGWIHGVYTPEDTIVFGGNYLHPFALGSQLRVLHLENQLRVPSSQQFPFFEELMWYTARQYVRPLLCSVIAGFGARVCAAKEAAKRMRAAWRREMRTKGGALPASTDGTAQVKRRRNKGAPKWLFGLERPISDLEWDGAKDLASTLDTWLSKQKHRRHIPSEIGDGQLLVATLQVLCLLHSSLVAAASTDTTDVKAQDHQTAVDGGSGGGGGGEDDDGLDEEQLASLHASVPPHFTYVLLEHGGCGVRTAAKCWHSTPAVVQAGVRALLDGLPPPPPVTTPPYPPLTAGEEQEDALVLARMEAVMRGDEHTDVGDGGDGDVKEEEAEGKQALEARGQDKRNSNGRGRTSKTVSSSCESGVGNTNDSAEKEEDDEEEDEEEEDSDESESDVGGANDDSSDEDYEGEGKGEASYSSDDDDDDDDDSCGEEEQEGDGGDTSTTTKHQPSSPSLPSPSSRRAPRRRRRTKYERPAWRPTSDHMQRVRTLQTKLKARERPQHTLTAGDVQVQSPRVASASLQDVMRRFGVKFTTSGAAVVANKSKHAHVATKDGGRARNDGGGGGGGGAGRVCGTGTRPPPRQSATTTTATATATAASTAQATAMTPADRKRRGGGGGFAFGSSTSLAALSSISIDRTCLHKPAANGDNDPSAGDASVRGGGGGGGGDNSRRTHARGSVGATTTSEQHGQQQQQPRKQRQFRDGRGNESRFGRMHVRTETDPKTRRDSNTRAGGGGSGGRWVKGPAQPSYMDDRRRQQHMDEGHGTRHSREPHHHQSSHHHRHQHDHHHHHDHQQSSHHHHRDHRDRQQQRQSGAHGGASQQAHKRWKSSDAHASHMTHARHHAPTASHQPVGGATEHFHPERQQLLQQQQQEEYEGEHMHASGPYNEQQHRDGDRCHQASVHDNPYFNAAHARVNAQQPSYPYPPHTTAQYAADQYTDYHHQRPHHQDQRQNEHKEYQQHVHAAHYDSGQRVGYTAPHHDYQHQQYNYPPFGHDHAHVHPQDYGNQQTHWYGTAGTHDAVVYGDDNGGGAGYGVGVHGDDGAPRDGARDDDGAYDGANDGANDGAYDGAYDDDARASRVAASIQLLNDLLS